jgi:FixJ family two-component response regulator
MNNTPRVFVVDDQPSMLKAISRVLGLAGFDTVPFASAHEFLASDNATAPGCIVLDLTMPDMDGLSLQQALAARASLLPIIFLTGDADIATSVRAMKLGAFDFLTKPVKSAELVAAVRDAFARNIELRAARAESDDILGRLASLTPREQDVLARIVDGKLNKQVAAELGTVEQTVKVHRARVMGKMKAGSLAELVRLVERAGPRS